MRLGVGSYCLYPGHGIDMVAHQQAVELAKSNDVDLYYFAGEDMPIDGYSRIQCSWARGFGKHRKLAEMIREKNYDAFISYTNPFDVIATLSGTPHVLYDYGTPPVSLCHNISDLRYYARVNLSRVYSVPRARLVLPGSVYMMHELRSRSHCHRPMHPVHSGIQFEPVNGDTFDIGAPYILYVGRHVWYKNVHALLRVFEKVHRARPDVWLVTAGNIDVTYKKYFMEMAARVPSVRVLGFVDDVWSLYRGASVYATCSLWEGEDRPVLEAQSCGVPAVTFNNCSHPEVVKHGRCVESEDDMASAIIDYLDAPRNMHAAAHVREEFSVGTVVKSWTRKLEMVL
jgi:glycosyltransferase involved in cell wall biosynthesis